MPYCNCPTRNPQFQTLMIFFSNTGQVLCSLAETLVEYRNAPTEAKAEAAQLLSEAVDIFQKCLDLQEIQYASEARQNLRDQRVPGDVRMEGGGAEGSDNVPMEAGDEDEDERMGESGQWATIQTPVTKDQLLDAGLAELGACTTLCPLAAEGLGRPLAWVQDIANSLLEFKITPLSQDTGRQYEISLARANFFVALAEASFKFGGATDPTSWEASIRTAFDGSSGWNITTDFQALCDKADAHIQLAATVTEQGTEVALALAWKHYAFAARSLSSAAKLEPLKAEINIARGDVEILRAKIEIPVAIQSRGLLLKNAEVYYRGARRLEGGEEGVKREAMVKEAMVAFEMGGSELLKGIALDEVIKGVVIDAVDEGIFGPEWLDRVGIKALASDIYKRGPA